MTGRDTARSPVSGDGDLRVVFGTFGALAVAASTLFLAGSLLIDDSLGQSFCLGAFFSSLLGGIGLLVAAKWVQRGEERRRAITERETERRFRSLVEDSVQGINIHRGGAPLYVNRAFARMLGFDSPEEVLALDSRDRIVAPVDRERLRRYTEARLAGRDAPSTYEYEALRRDGGTITLLNVARVVDWEGSPAVETVATDISARKSNERALRVSEQRFRDFAEIAADWFSETDADLRFTYISERYPSILGLTREEILGRTAEELFAGQPECPDLAFLDERRPYEDVEFPWERPDGTLRVLRVSGTPVFNADGGFEGYRGVGRDVTEAHVLSQQLSYQASHDPLTGLVNRREFELRLDRALASARGGETEHALCYLDLDQFKVINDTCGHVAGDELLHQLGPLLTATVRHGDTMARLGGDEFGVLLEHCSPSQAERVAESLRSGVEDFRFVWEDKSFRIGVSIGLVSISAASESVSSVLSAADSACYAAKESGRNRINIYREDDVQLSRRRGEMMWVGRLNHALEDDRFQLYYQPIVPLDRDGDGAGEHGELLLRMEDECGSLVLPGAFLPAAERYNLATQLDRWVVDAALEWLAGHPRFLERLHLCAINLSGQSLGDPDFLDFVTHGFQASGVPPEKVCFEITETAAIANLQSATQFIRALKGQGCQFALDDFGSGLSSFAYLKNLPVDFLKIDGTFVREVNDDPIDLAMVRSINEIGHAMGKRTIAEFVESQSVLDRLSEPGVGVDYAQGYGVGEPQPLQALA